MCTPVTCTNFLFPSPLLSSFNTFICLTSSWWDFVLCNSPVSYFILGWEGLKRRNPEGVSLVRWRRNRQDLLQEPEAGGQRAGREPHRRRTAGMPAQNHTCRSVLPIPASSSLNSPPCFACEGDDWRSRQGRRWRGEPAGVPAYHEENLPLLTEERRRNVFPVWCCSYLYFCFQIYNLWTSYCVVPLVFSQSVAVTSFNETQSSQHGDTQHIAPLWLITVCILLSFHLKLSGLWPEAPTSPPCFALGRNVTEFVACLLPHLDAACRICACASGTPLHLWAATSPVCQM